MKEIYQKFIDSFDTTPKGFSGRKMTAFILTGVVIAIHVKWLALGDLSQIEMVLSIDYAFIAALFGMTTYQTMKSTPSKSKSDAVNDAVNDPVNDAETKKDTV